MRVRWRRGALVFGGFHVWVARVSVAMVSRLLRAVECNLLLVDTVQSAIEDMLVELPWSFTMRTADHASVSVRPLVALLRLFLPPALRHDGAPLPFPMWDYFQALGAKAPRGVQAQRLHRLNDARQRAGRSGGAADGSDDDF